MLILMRVQNRGVAHQTRLVLRSLAREEPIEIFEAIAGGPVIEVAFRGRLLGGRIVPLAPSSGVVAVILEYLGHGGRRLRDRAAETVKVVGQFRNLTVGDARVIAPREQRSARGRAHGSGVKSIERNAQLRDPR